MSAPDSPRELSFAELLRRFAEQTTRLLRAELRLARAEITESLAVYARSAVPFGAAALLGLGAFGALTCAIVAALALVLPLWAAALIVTAIYGAIAAGLGAAGMARMRNVTPLPTQTLQLTKEDIEWVKTRATNARR